MGRVDEELTRLRAALSQLEHALNVRQERHQAEIEAIRVAARADSDAMAQRVDQAIERLEAVLGG